MMRILEKENIQLIASLELLKILYNSLVESILTYCIVIWGGGYKNALRNVTMSQNTVIKIIFKKNRRHSTEALYKETKILPLRALFVYRCLIYLPKLRSHLPICEKKYNFRNTSAVLRSPLYVKSSTQRIATYFAPKFFNILPHHIKILDQNKLRYKILTKQYVIENYPVFITAMH